MMPLLGWLALVTNSIISVAQQYLVALKATNTIAFSADHLTAQRSEYFLSVIA